MARIRYALRLHTNGTNIPAPSRGYFLAYAGHEWELIGWDNAKRRVFISRRVPFAEQELSPTGLPMPMQVRVLDRHQAWDHCRLEFRITKP